MTTRIKKTSVANRVPNTFVLSTDGDIGVNTHDGKMYISNSSNVFEVGANISGDVTIGGNVSIGNQISTVRGIQFNTTNPIVPANQEGLLTWNPTEQCLDIRQNETTLQVGLEHMTLVRNQTGSTIPNGSVVEFVGANGDGNYLCRPFTANSSADTRHVIGLSTEVILDGELGRATKFGKVRDLDTSGAVYGQTWAVGDELYASATVAGGLSNVKPSPPNAAVLIGVVTQVSSSNGIVMVNTPTVDRLRYGSFTSNATQNAASSNTATPITYTTNEGSVGHSIVTYNGVTNSAIQCDQSGLYNYQFSLQLQSSSASKTDVWIWFRKNGTDIVDSGSIVSIESNGGKAVAAWNIIVSMDVGDKFQIMWATDDYTKVNVPAFPIGTFHPAVPSVILTVTQATI
jgi:hypothetical protein